MLDYGGVGSRETSKVKNALYNSGSSLLSTIRRPVTETIWLQSRTVDDGCHSGDHRGGQRSRNIYQHSQQVVFWDTHGSIFGRDLRNVYYDSLLRTELLQESVLVVYADDIDVLTATSDVELACMSEHDLAGA